MTGGFVKGEHMHHMKGKGNEILSKVVLCWVDYGVCWLLQTVFSR